MARRTQVFLKEFVVLFGFLSGVWVAVGVNPTATLLDVLAGFVRGLVSFGFVEIVFSFLPLAFLVGMLILIHRKGGVVGLLAVAAAFLGGAQIVSNPTASLILLAVALGLGFVATR